jgi:hypothetical protein
MVSKSDEYRAKAVECQQHATLVHDAKAKIIFQVLARSWWYLANRADQIDQGRLTSVSG